ncbi:hypothetical protein FE784_37995 [Paenibacillus hemerocallicola]|jgi:hypothetical protein|uniref:Uncharacterized protein n=1 Tax=Paenibacillus hemerocallicola TaxID=1172614 RepID=A0A5C4SWF1_9BACL|nr:hypothetical protein [Paenibacillus hemerocallicola]TNJ58678.1 hypothetical protein FE784_37995 [Paenibacillus hemerocallicola]
MSYRSISPHLKSSCYNCRHFQASSDMLNGLCFQNSADQGVAAIGIGTCGQFSMKSDNGTSRSKSLARSSGDGRRSATVAR